MANQHDLPSKLGAYLRRLSLEYERANKASLLEIVRHARTAVVIETAYDNWNGGTWSHDVIMFLPPKILGKIALERQRELGAQIASDLNACAEAVSNENFNLVSLELNDESDSRFQRAMPFSNKAQHNPDALQFWKPGHLRLFISHRDEYKSQARQLGLALETFGISAFVAHDTIEPMEVWQTEIEKGLETMEVMLAFVTDNFHKSTWTNQEVGFALGKGIPVIALKLEKQDPSGFIAAKQALKGRLDSLEASVEPLYELISEKLGQKKRLRQNLISAFVATPDWREATIRFQRLNKFVDELTDTEFQQVKIGFEQNDQLHNAAYLRNYDRFREFLERTTGKRFEVRGGKIVEMGLPRPKGSFISAMDDEIPF